MTPLQQAEYDRFVADVAKMIQNQIDFEKSLKTARCEQNLRQARYYRTKAFEYIKKYTKEKQQPPLL